MVHRKPVITGLIPFLLALMFTTGISAEEGDISDYQRRFDNGTQLYFLERWPEAAMEFRRAQEISVNDEDWSEALYWVILSELADSDYGSANIDMNALSARAPNSTYARDMVYHRARIYFNQGYFEDALLLFKNYIDSVSHLSDAVTSDRIAAAYFWMGECLYRMGQFDEAEKFYVWVVDKYPRSPKYDASLFRLELIKQKKIETELLALLRWSNEESLRSSENYQRTIRTYEQTLNEYQRRIAELSGASAPVIVEETQPQVIEETFEDNTYERLLERARLLNAELDRLINTYYSGGY